MKRTRRRSDAKLPAQVTPVQLASVKGGATAIEYGLIAAVSPPPAK